MEPYKLRRWKRRCSTGPIPFFTCARPGRSKGNDQSVEDRLVEDWVRRLPGGTSTTVVSLLGRKPDGMSEFSFYSFCGAFEDAAEHSARPTFQQWLAQHHPERGVQVIEHPTIDFKVIPEQILVAAIRDIDAVLAMGRTVVLLDSGGETRTGQVCRYGGFIEDPRNA